MNTLLCGEDTKSNDSYIILPGIYWRQLVKKLPYLPKYLHVIILIHKKLNFPFYFNKMLEKHCNSVLLEEYSIEKNAENQVSDNMSKKQGLLNLIDSSA